MAEDSVLRIALAAHTQTIKALMEFLDDWNGGVGGMPRFAADAEACALGLWLERVGASYGSIPAFAKAREQHHQFHLVLNEIVELTRSGARSEALARMKAGGAFSRQSRQMLMAFDELADAITRSEC